MKLAVIPALFILIIIAFPILSLAQNRSRLHAFGTLGVTRYEVSRATGLNVGGGVGWRPFGRRASALRGIEVGGELNLSPNVTDSPGGLSNRIIGTGDVRYYFALGRLEPFVGFSLGFTDFTQNPGGRSAPGNPPAGYIGALAAGMMVGIHDHWFLRPEFRGYNGIWRGTISGPGGNERHLYRTSVAIGYRW
jgi:hypothetical protein